MNRKPESAPDRVDVGPDAEAVLVGRIAAGDQQAFAEFYVLYRRRLARFLGRFLASRDTVDELINDVMFVVWQESARFQARSRVSTWVFGIAWHKALRALERQRRHDARTGPEPEQMPAAERTDLEERDWLRRGLDRLSPEHRLVVELAFYVGCSYEEIATIANCPVNTVKTRMFHARHRLQGILKDLDATHTGRRP
jgi:RNA polymerase sigma-70 factor (ECF subfamily)